MPSTARRRGPSDGINKQNMSIYHRTDASDLTDVAISTERLQMQE